MTHLAARGIHGGYTAIEVIEFGAPYGSGGIGNITQPLVGERIYGTMKSHQLSGATTSNRR